MSCNLFNFAIKSILQKARVYRNGTIFCKSVQLLAYENDIDSIGHIKSDVTSAFSAIERMSINMGLVGNEIKFHLLTAMKQALFN